jgi:hypothetical protein
MKTETLKLGNFLLPNLTEHNKKIIIYTFTFLFFPILISFLTVKYIDVNPVNVVILYFIIGGLFNAFILVAVFDLYHEDGSFLLLLIAKGVYVLICFYLAANTFYKPIIGSPIKKSVLKSNLNNYLKNVNYKYKTIYRPVNKDILNKLLKLNYVNVINKNLKFKSYNLCLAYQYKSGINPILAKKKCSVYSKDNNYKISKAGSLFLHTNKHSFYINAGYKTITNKKNKIKTQQKLKFKIIKIEKNNLTEFYPYLHYTAFVNVYSPTTSIYKKLTGKKYIFAKKIKLRLFYKRTFYGFGTNFKLKTIKIIDNKNKIINKIVRSHKKKKQAK